MTASAEICPKCGGKDVSVRYVLDDAVKGGEHLAVKCARCEYRWKLPCHDARQAGSGEERTESRVPSGVSEQSGRDTDAGSHALPPATVPPSPAPESVEEGNDPHMQGIAWRGGVAVPESVEAVVVWRTLIDNKLHRVVELSDDWPIGQRVLVTLLQPEGEQR